MALVQDRHILDISYVFEKGGEIISLFTKTKATSTKFWYRILIIFCYLFFLWYNAAIIADFYLDFYLDPAAKFMNGVVILHLKIFMPSENLFLKPSSPTILNAIFL